jgi:hypothetical protein
MRVFYVYIDKEYQCFYYYNAKTRETTYSFPDTALIINPDTLSPVLLPTPLPNSTSGPPWRPHFFFAYPDDQYDCYYYFDTVTHKTTYTWPTTGVVLDPKTLTPLPRPPDVPVEEWEYIMGDTSASRSRGHRGDLRKPAGAPPPQSSAEVSANSTSMPKHLQLCIHRFQVSEYAREFFREHHFGLFGKRVTLLELTRWQRTPLKGPLLKKLGDQWTRDAVRLFKLILLYTGADGSTFGGLLNLEEIFKIVYDHVELRDELYFQLIKQSTGNPLPECLYRTWSIFLVAASTLPSSRGAEDAIRAHISQSAAEVEPRIAELIEFTGMRFYVRCLLGKPMDHQLSASEAMTISVEHRKELAPFAASLEEHMWAQRRRFPKMPVPIIPHNIATAILANGGENREGLFRLPGNMKKVAELQERISTGAPFTDGVDVNDLASLFKAWYGALPETLISKSMTADLAVAAESKSMVAFANRIPELPRVTLKYLFGFLRHIAAAEAKTKMTPNNLAICFAPNLVDLSPAVDPIKAKRLSEYAQKFVAALIESWDVSDVYPLMPYQTARGRS